jgi:hypothetical protein
MLWTKTSRSTPRAVVEYVRYTSSPSRRKTLSANPRPAAILGERRAARRHERQRPAHSRLVRLDLRQRHVGHRSPADAALGQRDQARGRYVVRELGAARAVVVRAVVHELVGDQLSPALEKVDQRLIAGERVERVLRRELDHREAPALRVERVERAGSLLLGLEKLVAGLLPLLGWNDSRPLHGQDCAPRGGALETQTEGLLLAGYTDDLGTGARAGRRRER